MEKAKSLSGCYRDNDPPQSYYKRKGLVPPDKMVKAVELLLFKVYIFCGLFPSFKSNFLSIDPLILVVQTFWKVLSPP